MPTLEHVLGSLKCVFEETKYGGYDYRFKFDSEEVDDN